MTVGNEDDELVIDELDVDEEEDDEVEEAMT